MRPGLLTSAIQLLIVALLLAILGGVLLVLFSVAALVSAPSQLAGGVGQQVGGVVAQAGRAAGGAQAAIQNATDPNRPPTGLTYDTEFAALQVWHTGEALPGTSLNVLTVQSIQRRQNADSPQTALYAVIHAELRQPRETRLFGQLIRSESDPHDYPIYIGESFRAAGTLYRVNWISQDQAALAAGTYRNPDAVSAPLKFDVN